MKNQMFFEKNKVEKIIILNYVIIAFVAVVALASLCFIYHYIYKTIDTGKNHVLVKINPDFEPIVLMGLPRRRSAIADLPRGDLLKLFVDDKDTDS